MHSSSRSSCSISQVATGGRPRREAHALLKGVHQGWTHARSPDERVGGSSGCHATEELGLGPGHRLPWPSLDLCPEF
eukprot:scaffold44617_cov30-Tisochrysis_lutea.AAC.1